MKKKKALILGCGYVGKALKSLLLGQEWEVISARRTLSKEKDCLSIDVSQRFELPSDLNLIFYLVSADNYTENAYKKAYLTGIKNTLEARRGHEEKTRLLFVSSTSVFEEDQGASVDEFSPTTEKNFATKALLGGEKSLSMEKNTVSIRFSGIYGPGRQRLLDELRLGKLYRKLRPQISNRIHQVDCARALAHIAELEAPASLYIASDPKPTPINTLIEWLAKATSLPLPPYEEDTPNSNHRSNKSCSSQLLEKSGFQFTYPSYKEGFEELIRKDR